MYERLRRALLGACALFGGVGLALAFGGERVFGFWRDAVAGSIWGGAFPAELEAYAAFTDGILGGSIVGKWVAIAWLVHEPLRRRERWALVALLAAHGSWFALDATASVLYGAAVNVWLIDLFPLLLVGGLTAAMWPSTEPAPPAGRGRAAVRVLALICAASVGTGLAATFAIRSPIFALYAESTAALFFGGAQAGAWLDWQRFAYGLIGPAIVGQFVALAFMLWRAPTQRWVLWAVATSMTAWFVVDTTTNVMHGAWFNVVQINLPSWLGTMVPCVIALSREAAPPSGVSSA